MAHQSEMAWSRLVVSKFELCSNDCLLMSGRLLQLFLVGRKVNVKHLGIKPYQAKRILGTLTHFQFRSASRLGQCVWIVQ